MSPDLGDVTFENRTRDGARRRRRPTSATASTGSPARCTSGPRARWRSTSRRAPSRSRCRDPNLYTARALRQALAEAGIAITGTTRSTTDSMLYRAGPRAAPPLAEVASRPLRDWIFPILNTSQNWFAEMLLKQLGRQFGRAGSWDEGLEVERRFLIDSVRRRLDRVLAERRLGPLEQNLVSPLGASPSSSASSATHPRSPPSPRGCRVRAASARSATASSARRSRAGSGRRPAASAG